MAWRLVYVCVNQPADVDDTYSEMCVLYMQFNIDSQHWLGVYVYK